MFGALAFPVSNTGSSLGMFPPLVLRCSSGLAVPQDCRVGGAFENQVVLKPGTQHFDRAVDLLHWLVLPPGASCARCRPFVLGFQAATSPTGAMIVLWRPEYGQ